MAQTFFINSRYSVCFLLLCLNLSSVATSDASERDSKCFLYTVDSDGKNLEFIGGAPGYSGTGSPVYSADAAMIAFDAFKPYFDYLEAHIFVYAIQGPFRGSFRDLGYGNVPSWSPDGKEIAFMLNPGTPDGEQAGVYLMNSDGSNRRRVCDGWAPHWSPDGEKLVYQNYQGGLSVHLFKTDEEVEVVSRNDFTDFFAGAAWSPDSEKLAFIGRHDGKRSLVIAEAMKGDGEDRIVWSEDEEIGFPRARPAWSPDGQQLIFQVRKGEPTSHFDRVYDNYIYTISVEDPSEPKLLEGKKIGTMNTSPCYSPDGEQVIFSSQR